MRIIAGKHRGRVLAEFKGMDVRPTSDRVKESLFSILTPRLVGARVLDLFCGSGALGLESLSRGASEAVFNDSARESLRIVKSNLSALKEVGQMLNYDYKVCLSRVEGKFDVIFCDPPYAYDYLSEILLLTAERQLLTEGGIVVYEGEQKTFPKIEGWDKFDERRYGRTAIAFYRRIV